MQVTVTGTRSVPAFTGNLGSDSADRGCRKRESDCLVAQKLRTKGKHGTFFSIYTNYCRPRITLKWLDSIALSKKCSLYC